MGRRDGTVEMKRVFMMLAEGRMRTKERVEVRISILLTSAWKTENEDCLNAKLEKRGDVTDQTYILIAASTATSSCLALSLVSPWRGVGAARRLYEVPLYVACYACLDLVGYI